MKAMHPQKSFCAPLEVHGPWLGTTGLAQDDLGKNIPVGLVLSLEHEITESGRFFLDFLDYKKSSTSKTPEFQNLASKEPSWQPYANLHRSGVTFSPLHVLHLVRPAGGVALVESSSSCATGTSEYLNFSCRPSG